MSKDPCLLPQPVNRSLVVGVGIATVGRPSILSDTVADLRRQTQPADAIIVCAPTAADVTGLSDQTAGVSVISGPRGSSHQRNAILEKLVGFDVVVFFDDDFIASRRYLEAVETIFLRHPEVVVITGRVLADGIRGPGLTHDEASRILSSCEDEDYDPEAITDVDSGYGCNMAVRLRSVQAQGIRFDERLPLYAWLEDVDFSRQLLQFGRIVNATAPRGVHLGVKTGRQPGRRLGYSQIANPIYLMRKGTCSWRKAVPLMVRNIVANFCGCVMPEPYIDRLGRVTGNVRALLDLLSGRLDPSRALLL